MIDQPWGEKVERIIRLCAQSQMPVGVEEDVKPDGVDAILELGDIPMEKIGDVYDLDLTITLRFSTAKKNWKMFLSRLAILTQKLCADTFQLVDGWVREDNESDLIYIGTILVKGRVNGDILV